MTHVRGLAALLIVLVGLTEARAQFVVGGRPSPTVNRSRTNANVGVPLRGSVGTFPVAPRYAGLTFGTPYRSPYWGYRPSITTNIFIFAPPPIFTVPSYSAPQSPVVVSPPVVVALPRGEPNLVDPIVIRPRNLPQPPDNDAPLPGAPAGGFRPIRPEDRARAMQPAQPDRPAAKKADPPDEARPDPLLQGKQAFAAREYGRALRFFKQAVADQPKEFLPLFLLAEAQFALGKYREAVATIHDGLRLHRDWPLSRFKPPALYGANAADYADHLQALQDALKARPDDAVLLFLSAYHLWFDGQDDEARRLFGRARKLVTEPRFIDLFLLGAPGGPVAAR